MRSKNKIEAEWMTLIQTCRSSGLTDRSWCEQNGISINTFYNTISKLRKKSCVIPKLFESRVNELPKIVPVSVSNTLVPDVSGQWNTGTPETDTSAAITITVNGCKNVLNIYKVNNAVVIAEEALRIGGENIA